MNGINDDKLEHIHGQLEEKFKNLLDPKEMSEKESEENNLSSRDITIRNKKEIELQYDPVRNSRGDSIDRSENEDNKINDNEF